jgi:hypothetical protein
MIKVYVYKLKAPLILFTLSLVLFITFGLYGKQHRSQVEDLRHQYASLNERALRSLEKTTLKEMHKEEFAQFEACKFEHTYIKEDLRKTYPYAIEFGPIAFPSPFKNLISQEVTFSIPCLRDQEVFALIGQLIHKGPGIFKIHEITIKRVSPLSIEMLEKIALGKPQTLLDGKVRATWIHM